MRPPTRGFPKARRLTYTHLRTPSTFDFVLSSTATTETIPLSRRRGCPSGLTQRTFCASIIKLSIRATELFKYTARSHRRSLTFYNRTLFSANSPFSGPLGTSRRPKVGRSHHQYLQLVRVDTLSLTFCHCAETFSSDHRIRHSGLSPYFYAAEASLLRPNDSIHDSASTTAGRIPDTLSESNDDRSLHVPCRWTDSMDSVLPECLSKPLEYIDPCLLATQEHEHQHYLLSEISQSAIEASAQNFQSQFLLDFNYPEVQLSLPTPNSFPGSRGGRREELLSRCSRPVPSQTTGSSSSGEPPSDAPDGKMKISPVQHRSVCPACKKAYPSPSQYRKHLRVLGCQASFSCNGCVKQYKYKKDLQRHQGHKNALPACKKPKSGPNTVGAEVNPFACIRCLKVYTRKDSLIRHMRTHKSIAHV